MIQNKVTLDHKTHTYTDSDGRQYSSVSKVLDSIEDKQNWNEIAGKVAGKGKFAGQTKEEVLAMWEDNKNKAANHGTKIHKVLEDYGKTFSIEPEHIKLEPMVKSVYEDYASAYNTHDEVSLYYNVPGFFISGTADKLIIPKKNCGTFSLVDYKSNLDKGEKLFNGDKYFKDPVSHLKCCSHNRYCLQLSIYSLMVESLTGWKLDKMWVTYISASSFSILKVPIPYMKLEAIAILENFNHAAQAKPVLDNSDNLFIFDMD